MADDASEEEDEKKVEGEESDEAVEADEQAAVVDTAAINDTYWHILLDHELADEGQLQEAMEEHERTGTPFADVLYNFGFVTQDKMLELLAETLGTSRVDMRELVLDPELIAVMDGHVARQYNVLPIAWQDDLLHIVAADPMNFQAIDEVSFIINRQIVVNVAKPEEIEAAIEHYYPEHGDDSLATVISEMSKIGLDDDEEDEEEEQEDVMDMANRTPIVKFVNVILYQAVKDRASDIHFEPFATEFRIRLRIDGTLYEMAPPPAHLAVPITSRVKVLSGLDIAERRLPQDGRIQIRVAGKKIDLRVSSLPTKYGESVVMRILDKSAVNLDLDVLGLPDSIKQTLRETIRKPNGIVLVTGPTGSGKTTTLYSCLKEINTIEDKVLTAEDPVEFDIEGLMQVPVQESIGMTFAKALKAFLRQDPDRIMVGEVRDLETAGISVEAALTGHLVLTTLHTNDAPSSVTRLSDMGVEPFLITSTLECALAQRLVRRICTLCKTQYDPTEEELAMLGVSDADIGDNQFCYGKGCEACNSIGYRGRVGLYELFVLSPALRELILAGRPAGELTDKAREEGMKSLRQSGISALLDGITTVEEVLKYT
jgi:type IV pilus assembly protein PilB